MGQKFNGLGYVSDAGNGPSEGKLRGAGHGHAGDTGTGAHKILPFLLPISTINTFHVCTSKVCHLLFFIFKSLQPLRHTPGFFVDELLLPASH